MKVKLLTNICGPEGSFVSGEIVTLSETLANALIKDGHAKEIVEIKKELPDNIKKIFSENPESKQAFKETIDELRKPENVEKMASEIQGVIKKVEALKLNKKGGG